MYRKDKIMLSTDPENSTHTQSNKNIMVLTKGTEPSIRVRNEWAHMIHDKGDTMDQ